jgi:hypothetical protein
MTTTHTPTPWVVGPLQENGGYDCMTSAICVGPVTLDGADYGQERCQDMTVEQRARMEADAHFIARAVNCHEELLAALKAIVDSDIAQREEDEGRVSPELTGARVAIAKAEGRS